ncbi:MAG: hypothetical protein K2G05_03340 [Duncaniella sp.]|nr:hypothetical protein [Duncaniella sp.]
MKIIRITDPSSRQMTDLDFHPDSALLLPGRPMFCPDFAGDWHARLYMAVHINRLGKSISDKFASRYYDGAAPAIRIEPVAGGTMTPGVLSGMDSGFTHGAWIAVDELAAMHRLVINGNVIEVDMPDVNTVNRAVALVSQYTTLRMGDIILLPLDVPPVALAPHTYFTVDSAADRRLMEVKIV